jgi:hypothetical protein
MAPESRSFATRFATPTTPSRTGTVISEKAGHRYAETPSNANEPVNNSGVAGLLDPVDGLPVQTTELGETLLREIALQAETSHAISNAHAFAQDLGVALLGHHLTLVDPRSKVSTTRGTSDGGGMNVIDLYPRCSPTTLARMFEL